MQKSVDYIVIGAGSTGCVIANRLSADASNQVLLLEAGGSDRSANVRIPAALNKNFLSPVDWKLYTVPQAGMDGRNLYQPRGKCWGGSSSINAMIYIRGHRADYDHWGQLGNPGWAYDDVLPYFIRSERNHRLRSEYHSQDGPLRINDLRSPHPLSQTLLKAAHEAGYPLNEDFNGQIQEGFGLYQVTQSRGRRFSAADAYLHPVRQRPNLTCRGEAPVERLLIEGKKVVGVVYHHQGSRQEVRARREVILSAGSFHSPQILMLSGIGPSDHLRSLEIPVVHHLPGVGENLQDHLLGGIAFKAINQSTLDTVEGFPQVLWHALRFLGSGKGPLTSNVAEAGGFLRTSPDLPAPDLQFHFAPAFFIRHGFDNPPGQSGFSLGATLIQPYSKGRITLASPRAGESPFIDPNYFGDERDLHTMIKGYQIAENILRQPAFQPFRGSLHMPAEPLQDEAAIADHLRTTTETLYHPVGTCKMGTDPMAVVDARLRVHGLENLRVADASIMPSIIRGNTHAACVMIGEKVSDMILEEG